MISGIYCHPYSDDVVFMYESQKLSHEQYVFVFDKYGFLQLIEQIYWQRKKFERKSTMKSKRKNQEFSYKSKYCFPQLLGVHSILTYCVNVKGINYTINVTF